MIIKCPVCKTPKTGGGLHPRCTKVADLLEQMSDDSRRDYVRKAWLVIQANSYNTNLKETR